MKIHHAKVHALSEEADDVPAYRDPEALREVYAEYDSFPEMTEALGVDVEPQTVRRNMIKHGIHQPTVSDGVPSTVPPGTTTTDGNGESNASANAEPAVATAGNSDMPNDTGAGASAVSESAPDLPGGVTVQDVKSAVLAAETLYEVQKALGVDRETAMKILCTLNLMELVHGRVATKQQREELKAQIDERIANRSAV